MDEAVHPVGMPFPGGFKIKQEDETYYCPVKESQKDNPGAVCGICIAEQDKKVKNWSAWEIIWGKNMKPHNESYTISMINKIKSYTKDMEIDDIVLLQLKLIKALILCLLMKSFQKLRQL